MLESQTSAIERAAPSEIGRFWPLECLSAADLLVVSQHAEVCRYSAGALVLSAGSDDTFLWYLASGSVELHNGEKSRVVVDSGEGLGRFPLSNLRPHLYSVTALSAVTLFRVDKTVLWEVINRDDNPLHHFAAPRPTGDFEEDVLCARIRRDIQQGQVPIPSMPNVLVQIYRVINDEDADARKIARVIQADPGITARLLSTANSSFYRRGRSVESCAEAVIRLGPPAVRNLVTVFVARELFQSRVPKIQHYVKNLWTHSVMVAAIGFNLARATPRMNPDTALLAGLLHDIGTLCILGHAERHPEILQDEGKLAGAISILRGELGADVLRRWQMPEPIVNAAHDAEDWHRDPQSEPDYSDLVLISQLHHIAGDVRMWSMPRVHEVPAFKKMASDRLGPNLSLEILDEAQQYIDETASWMIG